jgi:hypothetical protein
MPALDFAAGMKDRRRPAPSNHGEAPSRPFPWDTTPEGGPNGGSRNRRASTRQS